MKLTSFLPIIAAFLLGIGAAGVAFEMLDMSNIDSVSAVMAGAPQGSNKTNNAKDTKQLTSLEARTTEKLLAFHWSQIESDSYSVYISNLKAIGCPEITIKRIIKAELSEELSHNGEIKGQEINSVNSSRNKDFVNSQQFIKNQSVEHLMATLFNEKATIRDATPMRSESNQALAKQNNLAVTTPILPLAFKIPTALPEAAFNQSTGNPLGKSTNAKDAQNLQSLTVTQNQEVLNDVKNNFIQDLGGIKQDPNDPSYHKKWMSAQSIADQRLRALVGYQAYNALSTAATQNDSPNTQP